MKRVVFIMVVFFLMVNCFTGTLSGIAGEPSNSCIDQLRQKLIENITYPKYARKEAIQGDVTLIFTVTDEKIVVKNVFADDVFLGTYIKEQACSVQCTDFKQIRGKEFKIKIRFALK